MLPRCRHDCRRPRSEPLAASTAASALRVRGAADETASALAAIARLIDCGWIAEAINRLSPMLASAPQRAGEISHLLARAALATGDGKQTATFLRLAEQHTTPRLKPRLRQTQGELLRVQRRDIEAEPVLRSVAETCRTRDPETAARALIGLAQIKLNQARDEAALELLCRAAALAPDMILAQILIGEAKLRRGDLAGALAAAKRALRPDLGDAALLGRIGKLLFRLGQADQAEGVCR